MGGNDAPADLSVTERLFRSLGHHLSRVETPAEQCRRQPAEVTLAIEAPKPWWLPVGSPCRDVAETRATEHPQAGWRNLGVFRALAPPGIRTMVGRRLLQGHG